MLVRAEQICVFTSRWAKKEVHSARTANDRPYIVVLMAVFAPIIFPGLFIEKTLLFCRGFGRIKEVFDYEEGGGRYAIRLR